MNTEVKILKSQHGFTELKNIDKYIASLKDGFKLYYNDEYKEIKQLKHIEFNKTTHYLHGFFGLLSKQKKIKGRVHKILWPSCNGKPIVFFIDNTLEYD